MCTSPHSPSQFPDDLQSSMLKFCNTATFHNFRQTTTVRKSSVLKHRDLSSSAVRSDSAPMAPAPVTLPRSIWAVGKNYLEHIKELPSILNITQEIPQEPVIFLKSGSSLLVPTHGDAQVTLPLPSHWSKDIHHEVELIVQLGADLQPVRAAIALDLTARDAQAELKKKGYPWTLAKSFPASCPIGPWAELQPGADLSDMTLHLEVNGEIRQHSSTKHMIFNVPTLLDYLTSRFPLEEGDLILTGTPEGVGSVKPGDQLTAWLAAGEVARDTQPSTVQMLSHVQWTCTAASQGSKHASSKI